MADPGAHEIARPSFAHASEAEFARILDFYQVRWHYEPHLYPILWDLEGNVLESFAPDFYLPELDLYVEMTTLRQKLVRKKNRKLRRLRELYPDVRIKLFYARDFRALMLKYGRVALADALSGTTGQVAHPGLPSRPSPPLEPAVASPADGAATNERPLADPTAEPATGGPATSVAATGIVPGDAGRESLPTARARRTRARRRARNLEPGQSTVTDVTRFSA